MSLFDSLFGRAKAALPTDLMGRIDSFGASIQSLRDKASDFMARSEAQQKEIDDLSARMTSLEEQLGVPTPKAAPVNDPDAPTELLPTDELPRNPLPDSPGPTAGPVRPD